MSFDDRLPQPEAPDDRILSFVGAHNLRDLGGLRTTTGHVLRSGRVFRSDYPGFAEENDRVALRKLALRTVVDLRRDREAAIECVSWSDHGVAYHRCPVVAGTADSWHARYPSYLSGRPEAVATAVKRIIEPASHPVLFHCAAGKDRTGVVAALLLSLLGASEEDIVADHLLSGPSVAPILARLVTMEPYATMLAADTTEDQLPRAEHMRSFLTWLRQGGGAATWLAEHGVADHAMQRFRDAMLTSN